MSKLAIIAIPVADAPTMKTDAEGNESWSFDPPERHAEFISYTANYKKTGQPHTVGATAYDVYSCHMRENFITPLEATPENPETVLPTGWVLAHAVRLQDAAYDYTQLPDIVIPAGEITDDVFQKSKTWSGMAFRQYIVPQYDNTDPDNPVLLGVHIRDRVHTPIPFSVDDTDPDNPVIELMWPGDGLGNGSYTYAWTEPAKRIPEIAETTELGFLVSPDALEPDGSYIYRRQQATQTQPNYELLHPTHPELKEWARDQVDEDNNPKRPGVFWADFTYGRTPTDTFYAGVREFSNDFSRDFR